MKAVCMYFQVHQPYRLRTYRFFDIGKNNDYFDEYTNRFIMQQVAEKCYLPANKLMLELIKAYGKDFRVAFSISGQALDQFETLPVTETREILPGVRLTFTDAGHLLGSASATLQLTEDGVSKTIVFSGDIGNTNQPIINDPHYLSRADYVVMESTYGDRLHGPRPDYLADLADAL